MLPPDQAKTILEQHRVKDADRRQLQAIAALPDTLRTLAYALLNRDENGTYIRSTHSYEVPTGGRRDYLREAALCLDALSAEERGQIFAALCPTLAAQFERAWQFQRGQPYHGLFRAPHRPDVTAHSRAQWLVSLSNTIGPYQQDILWLASYAPYLGYGTHLLGPLFAAALDGDPAHGDALFDILVTSARGEHATGGMGHHLPSALLAASRPDGWAVVERLLLGAQREEGVRQIILEALPQAHPQALRRLLRLVLDQNLARFSAVTLAANQWLGATWDSSQAPAVNRALARLLVLLEDNAARAETLTTGSGEEAYLALTALALSDVEAALPPAATLARDPQVERRFAGVHFLAQTHLAEARDPLLAALLDSDPRVVARASAGLTQSGEWGVTTDEFERIEAALPHLPARPAPVQPILWGEPSAPADRERIADLLLSSLGDRAPEGLIPHLGSLSQSGRVRAAHILARAGGDAPTVRTTLLDLLGDRSSYVREQAAGLLAKRQIRAADAPALEALLTRKSADLRRSLLTLLLKQPDAEALASVDRLLAAKVEPQRLAGLEALRQLFEAGRQPAECAARATAYERAHPDLSAAARAQLTPILDAQREVPTLENALGLADPTQCVVPPAPVAHPRPLFTPAAVAALLSLDTLIEEHRTTPYTATTYRGSEEVLLGANAWYFPSPDPKLPIAEDAARLPLADLWRTWAETRADQLRDPDGFEFARMLLLLTRRGADELRALLATLTETENAAETATPPPSLPVGEGGNPPAESATPSPPLHRSGEGGGGGVISPAGPPSAETANPSPPPSLRREGGGGVRSGAGGVGPRLTLRHPNLLHALCLWLMRLCPAPGTADFLLDHLETTLAQLPAEQLRSRKADGDDDPPYYRNRYQRLDAAVGAARILSAWGESAWSDAHATRLWRLLRWSEGLESPHLRYQPTLPETLAAHGAGACGEADLTMYLLGSRHKPEHATYRYGSSSDLGMLTARKPHRLLAEYPVLGPIVARCRQRVLEVELARGELPTAATPVARGLRSVLGIAWFVRLVAALEGQRFTRGGSYGEQSRAEVLSHLLRVSFPTPDETPTDFAEAVRAAHISDARLIEAAVYAPQWARCVEHVLGWPIFTQAVWWIYAHTRDRGWEVDSDVRAEWQAQIAEWTPLASDDLYDGAVDVAWFGRVYATLGAERWQALYAAAKYASSGGGHARAQLFADAMLGQVEERALTERITAKRNRDAVCALGLVPLPVKASAREAAILRRYQTLQAFLRTARKFGAQRRENDGKAARIGLENLARTAGYSDPQRFQWAMELREAEDLRGGSLSLTQGPVTITLRIDALGQPHIEVEKAGKALKDIPAALKKVPEVAALRERKKTLEQQLARMRLALEQSMCRAESFPVAELSRLLEHPILAPLLEQLIFTGEAGMGYLMAGGRALRAHDGEEVPLAPDATLRIAHPHDLYRSGAWSQWQHECFAAERIQPFKQVFRELYPLSEAEQRAEGRRSQRYAGQQIQPKQAMALLGQRGWLTSAEDGGASRTFHEPGITAEVGFLYGGGTSVDVEGLTIEEVTFHQAGETWGKPLALAEVPPILFSEVMRDLDLVVSVAHRGGVDPEGSVSTVEMRTALLREVGAALGLENVRLHASHAIVRGSLGEYSVHLGSGVVHLLPGGALCIIPVHAQHRGRVFLPFADDDPKTAEIVSKVVLLAHDSELKDPLILQQIYARA